MKAAAPAPAPLAVGDHAWAFICAKETGNKGRREILGEARVEVVAIVGDRFDVRAFRASGRVSVGRIYRVRRMDLYAMTGPEHVAFGAEIARLYAPRKLW